MLIPELEKAIEKQKKFNKPLELRILTSDYLNITPPDALQKLLSLKNEGVTIKIFETAKTRKSFHVKSYIFIHSDETQNIYEGSAFVGSNNISELALTDAHEWCLRHDYKPPVDSENAKQFQLIRESFDKIFNHDNAKILTDEWIKDYRDNYNPPKSSLKDGNLFPDEIENLAGEQKMFTKPINRPTLTELYQDGNNNTKKFDKEESASWFIHVINHYEISSQIEGVIKSHNTFLFYAVQKTKMQKSFKMILLEAFLNLGGFRNPPTMESLTEKSWNILNDKYYYLWERDVPDEEKTYVATDKRVLSYWEKNPIKHSMTAYKETGISWFIEENNKFKANFFVAENHIDILHNLVQELVDYRLEQYAYEKGLT